MGVVFTFMGVPAKEFTKGLELTDPSKKVALHQERNMSTLQRKEVGAPTCAFGPVGINLQPEGGCHRKTALPSLPLP